MLTITPPPASAAERHKDDTRYLLGNPHFGKLYAVNLNHAYEELEGIVEQVSVQLDIGCVVENLER